jgi:hypothetical protein
MSTANRTNINTSTINALGSNISINNTIIIPQSALTTSNTINNANACIFIKDVNSNGIGSFYPLKVNSSEYTTPYIYFNNNLVIDSSNLLNELEYILSNYPLETSNIIVNDGYINFFNGTIPNSNQGSDGVGLRYNTSNNTMQFKNFNTDWIDLADITKHDQFTELNDVDVYTNPLMNNQYIIYNASSNLFVNANLAIINDNNPTLGNDLQVGEHSIVFSSNTNIFFDNTLLANTTIRNPFIALTNNTTTTGIANFLEFNNADTGYDPSIICKGTDTNISLNINTKGTGDISINASLGNIYTNSDSMIISGFLQNSIYRTSSNTNYQPTTQWNIPTASDIVLFDFINSSPSGTYWANVSAGIDGQKLNLIYNNKGSNTISVLANFGTNGIIIGSGYCNGLTFTTTGQSTSLVYLANGIDAWQVLNTGSSVF